MIFLREAFYNFSRKWFFNNLGFTVNQQKKQIRKDAYWFGEAQGRVVVTVSAEKSQ